MLGFPFLLIIFFNEHRVCCVPGIAIDAHCCVPVIERKKTSQTMPCAGIEPKGAQFLTQHFKPASYTGCIGALLVKMALAFPL